MAALLVLLLLLAVPPTAFTTTDVYYVTAHDAAGHEQSCPPHQICHNLSYYISRPDSYFTSDTTIIFLKGEHSFDREDLVLVSNVHNLTLKGQGQWPVAGAEETVMQSTVIINCTRKRGGFNFTTSHNITVEGLTVVNCGGLDNTVFYFSTVQNISFHKNSIQHMTGYGLFVHNCDKVIVTNCSYYHSSVCNISDVSGGGVGIVYNTQYSNTGYTLELSYSNMTKCCSYGFGGGIDLDIQSKFGSARLLFSHLVLSHNKALYGGGFQVEMHGEDDVTLVINNCLLVHGSALTSKCVGVDCDKIINGGGGMHFDVTVQSTITIQNTQFLENFGHSVGEIYFNLVGNVSLSILNSTIVNEETYSGYGVWIFIGHSTYVTLANTRIRFANLLYTGFYVIGSSIEYGNRPSQFQMVNCQFERCKNVSVIVYLKNQHLTIITNCIFSKNTGDHSVIYSTSNIFLNSSIISDNNMTGITLDPADKLIKFIGRNVIQNNRNTEGAGITLVLPAHIQIDGELILYNNTADEHGGAILMKIPSYYTKIASLYSAGECGAGNSWWFHFVRSIELVLHVEH